MREFLPPPFEPETSALFLDFDGTLVEFADDPDDVALPPGGRRLIERLERVLDGALVLVTGRRIASLDCLIEPLRPAAGGLHGLELRDRPNGPIRSLPVSGQVAAARQRLAPLVKATAGLRLEDKHAALVVHFRGRPELSRRAEVVAMTAVTGLDDLVVVPGHAIFEIRMAAVGKGEVVRNFMGTAGFADRTPVFVGDDRTDEDGFAAARALGGYGVKIGDGDTGASYRLPDVAAVHDYLRRVVGFREPPATAVRGQQGDIQA